MDTYVNSKRVLFVAHQLFSLRRKCHIFEYMTNISTSCNNLYSQVVINSTLDMSRHPQQGKNE